MVKGEEKLQKSPITCCSPINLDVSAFIRVLDFIH